MGCSHLWGAFSCTAEARGELAQRHHELGQEAELLSFSQQGRDMVGRVALNQERSLPGDAPQEAWEPFVTHVVQPNKAG